MNVVAEKIADSQCWWHDVDHSLIYEITMASPRQQTVKPFIGKRVGILINKCFFSELIASRMVIHVKW